MSELDEKLGGTATLDIVIYEPDNYLEMKMRLVMNLMIFSMRIYLKMIIVSPRVIGGIYII